MKRIIKCYAGVYKEDGRISYFFNRMPDDVSKISFTADESVFSILSEEQRNTLSHLLCEYIAQNNPFLTENARKPSALHIISPYDYYIEFDLEIDVKCKDIKTNVKHTYIKIESERMKDFLNALRQKKKEDLEELESKFLYFFGNEANLK